MRRGGGGVRGGGGGGFFFSSRRRHTRYIGDWSSDVCSSDLDARAVDLLAELVSNYENEETEETET